MFRVIRGIPPDWEGAPESSLRAMWGRIALATVSGVLLAAAGCGGDDETKPRPSKSAKRLHERSAEFHRKGEAICREVAREAAVLARGIVHGDPVAAMARIVEAEERLNRRLAALEPPSSRAARLQRRVVGINRASHRVTERLYASVQQGVPFLAAVAEERRPSRRLARRSNPLFKRLGLPSCTTSELGVLARGYY